MFKIDTTITLVTIASPFDQNLALNTYELIGTHTIASIHEGYINVIPIINPERRCRYVSIYTGKNRGKGVAKQIKWLKFGEEVLFVIASTAGLQVYDVEVYDMKFSHTCRAYNRLPDYANGLCVVEGNVLCVGTSLGTIFLYQYAPRGNFSMIAMIDYFHAHDEPIALIDGKGKYLVSSSAKTTYLWVKDKKFEVMRQIYVEGLFSTPTTLKMTRYLILIGYESGEFCIFDVFDSDFVVRTVAHKLKVSGIDFCVLKQLILTGSVDSYIKLWTFRGDKPEASCIFSIVNENGPLCGVGFLNDTATQFCVVSANSIKINVYVKDTNANVII